MPRIPVRQLAVVLSLIIVSGCVSNPPTRRIWVEPRVNLKTYETIGMVEFSSTSKGALAALTTRKFAQAARRDQDMLRMIEVGRLGELPRRESRQRAPGRGREVHPALRA